VPSDDPVNARWTDEGVTNTKGTPFYTLPPAPSPKETREEADRLRVAWNATVNRMDVSPKAVNGQGCGLAETRPEWRDMDTTKLKVRQEVLMRSGNLPEVGH
jgi:hypothetical protein